MGDDYRRMVGEIWDALGIHPDCAQGKEPQEAVRRATMVVKAARYFLTCRPADKKAAECTLEDAVRCASDVG